MWEHSLVGVFSFSNYSHRGDEEAALMALAMSCFLYTFYLKPQCWTYSPGAGPRTVGSSPTGISHPLQCWEESWSCW